MVELLRKLKIEMQVPVDTLSWESVYKSQVGNSPPTTGSQPIGFTST